MIESSKFSFETLRQDGAFALYRGRKKDGERPTMVVVAPESVCQALLGAFAQVVESGIPELVLVSGYSGIGKCSVVNELHKEIVAPHGAFISGKFDQNKRDIHHHGHVR